MPTICDFSDRVLQPSTTTGLANMAVSGTIGCYQTWGSQFLPNTPIYYLIDNCGDLGGTDFEIGRGLWNGAAIVRQSVLSSSNGGAFVNFPGGTKYVRNVAPAEWFEQACGEISDLTNNVSVQQNQINALLSDVNDLNSVVACGIPVGTIQMYPAAAQPSCWQFCFGQAISRATYSDLFAVIGTSYGIGNGSTTFNLPDLRARSPIGAAASSGLTFRPLGGSGGAENHSLTVAQMPAHNHNNGAFSLLLRRTGSNTTVFTDATASEPDIRASGTITSQGNNQPHNNMHPWLALNFIIYTGV